MKRKKSKNDVLIFIIILILIIGSIYLVSALDFLKPLKINDDSNNTINYANISIDFDDFLISYNVTNRNSLTVADLLFECVEFYNISIEKKYWTGYDSYSIESINNVKNGMNNCYWQFYVNGNLSDVGCDNYFLMDQDFVEWRFEKSIWN